MFIKTSTFGHILSVLRDSELGLCSCFSYLSLPSLFRTFQFCGDYSYSGGRGGGGGGNGGLLAGRTFRHPQLPMCSPLDFLVGLAAACFSLLVVAVILCCQKGTAQAKQKVFLLDVDFSRHLDTLLHIKLLPFHEDIFLFQSYASFEKGLLEQKHEFFPKTNSFAL